MHRNIKNNKNSAMIPQYTHYFSDIYDIIIYFCSLSYTKYYVPFLLLNVRWMLCILFWFFYFRSKISSEKVGKPTNEKIKGLKSC